MVRDGTKYEILDSPNHIPQRRDPTTGCARGHKLPAGSPRPRVSTAVSGRLVSRCRAVIPVSAHLSALIYQGPTAGVAALPEPRSERGTPYEHASHRS